MKKIVIALLITLFSITFSFPGLAYVIGDINKDDKIDMTEAIHALQVASSVRTAANARAMINVPAQIPTIQKAIDAAAPGDVINVATGTYTETLTINNKALTIQGAGSGMTTINGVSGSDTLTIDGSKGVIISGVTIQKGGNGILAIRGAVVEVADAVVQDTTERGILIRENATARLTNVTVQRSGIDGIQAILSSSIVFSGTIVSSNNIRDGFYIVGNSSALFSGATVTVNANSRNGITVSNSAGLLVDGSSITIQNGLGSTNNNGKGIRVNIGSSFHLQNNSSLLIENNGLDGIGVGFGSSFLTEGSTSLTVRSAKRVGIDIYANSSVSLSGTVLVENSASFGVAVGLSCALTTGGAVTIQNNVNIGLLINQGTARVDSPGILTVRGTTGSGQGIRIMAQSSFAIPSGGMLVQNNMGSGINLVDGSQLVMFPSSPQTVVIQNNDTGIFVSGSGLSGSIGVTIKGNTTKDLSISFASRASLLTGSYDTIECSQSYTTMGVSCP